MPRQLLDCTGRRNKYTDRNGCLRYVWGTLILLFPLAVVFAWLFEITASGIRRIGPVSAQAGADFLLRRTDFVILVALLVIGAMISYRFLGNMVGAERRYIGCWQAAISSSVRPRSLAAADRSSAVAVAL